jgi:hypothetical protein
MHASVQVAFWHLRIYSPYLVHSFSGRQPGWEKGCLGISTEYAKRVADMISGISQDSFDTLNQMNIR